MAIKTKVQFVQDMINEFPDATRAGIINRLIRHRVDYRGKKFNHQTAARYYWYVTTQLNTKKPSNQSKSFDTNRTVSLYFRKNTNKHQRLAYAMDVLSRAGVLND